MTTTIFTHTFTNQNPGNNGGSDRIAVPLSGPSLGQIRVTFQAGTAAGLNADHVGIALQGTATLPATQFAPVELKFSGTNAGATGAGGSAQSGFLLPVGASIVSDFLTFSALSTDTLVFTLDEHATGSGCGAFDTAVTGCELYFKVGTGFTDQTGTGYSIIGTNDLYAVAMVETQAGGGGGGFPLLLPSRRVFVRR
jgi:hypothetical protein